MRDKNLYLFVARQEPVIILYVMTKAGSCQYLAGAYHANMFTINAVLPANCPGCSQSAFHNETGYSRHKNPTAIPDIY